METMNPGGGASRRVVVGVDDSPGGLAALRHAVDMARAGHAPLVAIRSWGLGLPRHGGRRRRRVGSDHGPLVPFFNGAEQRQKSAQLIRLAFGDSVGGIPRDIAVAIRTPEGDPGRVLAEFASAGDVLVVGTGRDQAVKRFMHGSVSHYCSVHARCPVVVVVPPPRTADKPGAAAAA
jgi:nucleotide-binding universal stress UspA family protein